MLREFDLDAPTLSKEARQSFRHQTRCVTALYERYFKPFPLQKGAWKVLVEVVSVITKHQVRDLLGVLTLQIQGDPVLFLEAAEVMRPKIALDWLTKGVTNLAMVHDWSLKPFQDAADAVVEVKFVNKWVWKTQLWNPMKTFYCEVEIEHGLREARIRALFKNPDALLIEQSDLCFTPPSEFAFVPLLGKVHWIDERQVELISKDGKKRWIAAINIDSESSH